MPILVTRKLTSGAIPTKKLRSSLDDNDSLAGDSGASTTSEDPLKPTPSTSKTPRKLKGDAENERAASALKKWKSDYQPFETEKPIKVDVDKLGHLYPSGETAKEYELVIKRYHKLMLVKSREKKYDSKFQFFILNLYLSSPQCYKMTRTALKLPTVSTILRFKLNIRSKLDERIMNVISTIIGSLPDSAKHCSICIGKMPLKRHLYYDIVKDEIIGIQNTANDGSASNEVASHAFVMLLRGIRIDWQQPLCYAYLASAKHFKELDDWINEVISQLSTLGIKVKAIVTDHNSAFDQYAKEFKLISPAKPYFIFNERKVYWVSDVALMLNRIRNYLLTNDFYYCDKRISWDYISSLYAHQKKHKVQLLPKLSDAHIEPDDIQKMQVRYAAQVFSRSVYGALNTFIHARLLPEEARPTAEFVIAVNNIFDVLNSSAFSSYDQNRQPLTLNENQIEVMDTAQNMFRIMTAINRRTGEDNTNKITVFRNFDITIQAMKMLAKELRKERVNFILTRRITNQSPLETFLATIQQEATSIDLTAVQFMRAFSKIFLSNTLNSCIKHCKVHLREFLFKKNDMILQKYLENPVKYISPIISLTLDGEKDYRLDFLMPQNSALVYVATYLLFKCFQRHTCYSYTEYLNKCPPFTDQALVSHLSRYNPSFEPASLKIPPRTFNEYIRKLEDLFLSYFNDVMVYHPGNSLMTLLQAVKFNAPCKCFPRQHLLKLYIRSRIYSTLKLNNKAFKSAQRG